MKTDLIFCLSHTKVCCFATRLGFLYGVQSDRRNMFGCGNCKVDFVDINFKKPDIDHHTNVVMKLIPKYATVLDITDMQQLDKAILTGSWFAGHGIQPILIPKIDCIGSIPKAFILGYSIPTKYGKTTVPLKRFEGRRIHILGGTPKRQAEYYRRFLELGCIITSIDGNAIHRAATLGTIWIDRFGHQWQNTKKNPIDGDFYGLLSISLENVWHFWQDIFDDPDRNQVTIW